jgi:hypothetical protein
VNQLFALVAAVLIFLAAVGVDPAAVDLFLLGLAFWALHFAVELRPWKR